MNPNKREIAKRAIHQFIGKMKTPISGCYIFLRNPWENHIGQNLYFGGSVSFSNPNGSLVLYGLGGNRTGRVRVTLTILRTTWEDTCSPSEIERTVSRFFRVWERKNPHRFLAKPL